MSIKSIQNHGIFEQAINNTPLFSSGLYDRPDNQRQHQLFPHVQENLSSPASDDGDQSCRAPRAGERGAAVLHRLPQRIPTHVSQSDDEKEKGFPELMFMVVLHYYALR